MEKSLKHSSLAFRTENIDSHKKNKKKHIQREDLNTVVEKQIIRNARYQSNAVLLHNKEEKNLSRHSGSTGTENRKTKSGKTNTILWYEISMSNQFILFVLMYVSRVTNKDKKKTYQGILAILGTEHRKTKWNSMSTHFILLFWYWVANKYDFGTCIGKRFNDLIEIRAVSYLGIFYLEI